jgi:hypothetical protein
VDWTDDYFILEFGLKGQLAIEYVSTENPKGTARKP